MRESLIASRRASPVREFEGYARGSIVICVGCARPLYRLARGIGLGEKVGRSVGALRPVTARDLETLANREDIDAGLRARLTSMDPGARRRHCQRIVAPKTGDPMACPFCSRGFCQARTVEATETLDRAYVVELVTVPPLARPAPFHATVRRGRQIRPKVWIQ